MALDWSTITAVVGGAVAVFAVLTLMKRRRQRNWTKAARGDLLRDRTPRN